VFDVVLFACGRTANVEELGLEVAEIEFDKKGVLVNDELLTTNSNVFAVGDCIDGPKFTHASGEHARTVIRNALFYGSVKKSSLVIPYCTYTDPEIA
jgi:pyruvate/2-oxoglutarate dehydrogenase complex dihydrolipoamide dehydrogenase (E3) component